ncbi:hypothetical protein [Nocardia bovistercoris]|uniref:Uncharacterized protein n=1 Tax=Nocardia bovistercoris TaxID=2785916 RepID=A0A931N5Q3_9NOCA|nr:hypothetical protein [Nocardia bovistercoris]MBH0779646.1 hypothetical protein [Nocardia bovistercoris]
MNDARFGRDGRLLVGAGDERVVRLWTTDPDTVADQICTSGSTLLDAAEWERQAPGYPMATLCPK